MHYNFGFLFCAVICVSFLPSIVVGKAQTQAWFYDAGKGDVACGAEATFKNNSIDVLKPGFISLDYNGNLEIDTTTSLCNAASPANIALWKQYSKAQFITVGSIDNGVGAVIGLVMNQNKASQAITTLTSFVVQNGLTGVEIDVEGYENWNTTIYDKYIVFLNNLGASLHAQGKQLMIDVPAIYSQGGQNYYKHFTYEGLNNADVDFIAIMSYTGQYDGSCGTPIASNAVVNATIKWAYSKITNHSKIIMGIPSFGYHCQTGTSNFDGSDTLSQSMGFPGFNTARRDPNSYEMMWTNGGISYVYQDQAGLDMKLALIESWGIEAVSIWFIGGNAWFSPSASSTTATTTPTSTTTKATTTTTTTTTSKPATTTTATTSATATTTTTGKTTTTKAATTTTTTSKPSTTTTTTAKPTTTTTSNPTTTLKSTSTTTAKPATTTTTKSTSTSPRDADDTTSNTPADAAALSTSTTNSATSAAPANQVTTTDDGVSAAHNIYISFSTFTIAFLCTIFV